MKKQQQKFYLLINNQLLFLIVLTLRLYVLKVNLIIKILFTLFFLSIFAIVFSQKMASFTSFVKDYKNAPLKLEQILMVEKPSKQVFKGVTNSSSTFDIDIPGGDIYDIKIKGVGDAKDYNTMEIPEIGGNQSYNKGTLTIMIE